MNITPFEQLLKQAMGLDAASIGSSSVERAVQERQAACHLNDAEHYWERLTNCSAELQALIETVAVPETWFFRDPAAFAALARLVGEERSSSMARPMLRLLSVPCSSGEEPYSMAMALLDAGLPASALQIDAVDISSRALALAERALYGRNSFRGSDLAFRERHFVAQAGGHRPSETVRDCVQFRQGNLLDGLRPGAAQYDIIFCRNVLIYFDRATQDHAIAVLGRLLGPRGWLFVGPSETALLSDHGYLSAKLPLAFAFRKGPPGGSAVLPRVTDTPTWSVPAAVVTTPGRASAPRAMSLPPVRPARPAPTDIDLARKLADQGHLAEAAAQCEMHLRAHGPSVEAFCLLGLVRDASGKTEDAAEQYRKALYLAPHHHEALIHLALLLHKQGDADGAQRLQQRASRLPLGEH